MELDDGGAEDSRRSKVWDYFSCESVRDNEVECKLCGKKVKRSNNTTNMYQHLENLHHEQWKEAKGISANPSQKTIPFGKAPQPTTFLPTKAEFVGSCLDMIMLGDLPFNFFEKTHVQRTYLIANKLSLSEMA